MVNRDDFKYADIKANSKARVETVRKISELIDAGNFKKSEGVSILGTVLLSWMAQEKDPIGTLEGIINSFRKTLKERITSGRIYE